MVCAVDFKLLLIYYVTEEAKTFAKIEKKFKKIKKLLDFMIKAWYNTL